MDYSALVEKAYRDVYNSLDKKPKNALNVRRRYYLIDKGFSEDDAKLKAIGEDPVEFRERHTPAKPVKIKRKKPIDLQIPATTIQKAFRGQKIRERANKQKTCREGLKVALPNALEGRRDKVKFEAVYKKRLAEIEATDACDLFDKATAILAEMKPKLYVVRTKPAPPPLEYIEDPEVVSELKEMLKRYQRGINLYTDYAPSYYVISATLLHLLKKYENNCYIFTRQVARTKGQLSAGVGFEAYDAVADEWKLAPVSDELVRAVGLQMANCITNGVKLIAIPMEIPAHQNMLVYRVADNSFERFEPHGAESGHLSVAENKLLDGYISKFVSDLEEGKYIPEGAKIYYASDVCPSFSFQSEEGKQWAELGLGDSGFCQMWSAFFLEMVLKYPEQSAQKLLATAYREMMAMGPYAFARHIADYSKELEVELKKINPTYSHQKADGTDAKLVAWLQTEFQKLVAKQARSAYDIRKKAVAV